MARHDSTYPLARTERERERLAIQALAWRPAAERLFDRIGVSKGWHCMDLGCGPVGVLEPLSRRVGPGGSVTGLDINPSFVGRRSSGNVTMICGDAFAPPQISTLFDLTHARFLLAPLARHAELMKTMIDITRPGGVIAVQEPDACSWRLFPHSACFQELVHAVVAGFAASGADFNTGRRLPQLLSRTGVPDVHMDAHVLTLSEGNPYLRMPLLMAQSMREGILGHDILSSRELDLLMTECERTLSSPGCFGLSFTLVQAWGAKPSGSTETG